MEQERCEIFIKNKGIVNVTNEMKANSINSILVSNSSYLKLIYRIGLPLKTLHMPLGIMILSISVR